MKSARQSPDRLRYARRILIILALIYAFVAGLRTLGDFDLGWQLATGRWMVQHREIPRTDVFSYTAAGKEWIYPALSQLVLYLSYAVGGSSLLSWLGAAASIGTVGLVLRRASVVGVVLAVVSVPLIAACTPPRTEMFTAVLFAAFVSILWQHHRSGDGRLWLLPMLMVLWVNLHLGFIAGLAMCAAYVGLELEEAIASSRRAEALVRLKKAGPWLIATVAATLANPWGWRIYRAIERQGSIVQTHSRWIWEWQGLRLTTASLEKGFAWRGAESAVFWMLAAAMVATVCALVRRQFMVAVMLAGASYLVIHAIRMEASFATIAVVIGGAMLGDTLKLAWDCERGALAGLSLGRRHFAGIAVVAIVAGFVGMRSWDLVTNRAYLGNPFTFSNFGAGTSFWQPEQAGNFVLKEQLPRNLFHDFNSGGFVVWKLSSQYPDYIDGRSVPFGSELLLRNMSLLEESLDSEEWTREADARDIKTILLSTDYEMGTALRSLGSYCKAGQWRPVFLDAFGAVFVRVKAETKELVQRLQIDCGSVEFRDPPEGASDAERFRYLLNVGTILVVLDRNENALQRLEGAERIFADNAFEHYAKGIALGNVGSAKESARELLRSIELGSTDDAPAALARIYDEDGRYQDEAEILRNAADLSNRPHWLYLMLGNVELKLGSGDLALAAFENAERESPFMGEAYEMGTEFRAQVAAGRERAMKMSRK